MTERVADLLKEMLLIHEASYQGLHLRFGNRTPLVVGELEFRARRKDIETHDSYEVEIQIPDAYPSLPPVVRETGGRIPRNTSHHAQPDGTLCLAPPVAVFWTFKKHPTLLRYVEDLLIPCLFWHSHNARHSGEPLDAYAHGEKGIAEYRAETDLKTVYRDIFDVSQVSIVLCLLRLACQEEIKDHQPCPCQSGESLIACHGRAIKNLLAMPYLSRRQLALDYLCLKDQHRKQRHIRRGN
jgi:hypothetical protein